MNFLRSVEQAPLLAHELARGLRVSEALRRCA
jgi:hypothetical protein